MNDLYNISGTIAWISATSMGIIEWLSGVEVNKLLTIGSLILGIIFMIYKIRTQRIELKIKQKEYNKTEDGNKQTAKE